MGSSCVIQNDVKPKYFFSPFQIWTQIVILTTTVIRGEFQPIQSTLGQRDAPLGDPDHCSHRPHQGLWTFKLAGATLQWVDSEGGHEDRFGNFPWGGEDVWAMPVPSASHVSSYKSPCGRSHLQLKFLGASQVYVPLPPFHFLGVPKMGSNSNMASLNIQPLSPPWKWGGLKVPILEWSGAFPGQLTPESSGEVPQEAFYQLYIGITKA